MGSATTTTKTPTTPIEYPSAPRHEATHSPDTPAHLTIIPDPYRWMEDAPSENPTLSSWITSENKLTTFYLNNVDNETREKLRKRVSELYDFDKGGCPIIVGEGEDKAFYWMVQKGLDPQKVMVRVSMCGGEQVKDLEVVLDPEMFVDVVGGSVEEKNEGVLSLGSMGFSKDGRFVAIGVHRKGLDWADVVVVDVKEEKVDGKRGIIGGVLKGCKFYSMAWTKDGKGFFYTRFEEEADGTIGGKMKNQKVYYHFVDSDQIEDVLVYEDEENEEYMFGLSTPNDARYLFVTVHADCGPKNLLYYIDLGAESTFVKDDTPNKLVKLVDEYRAGFGLIACVNGVCYFLTNDSAPNRRVIMIDLAHPEEENWKQLIPEHKSYVISNAIAVNETQLVVTYMKDVAEYVHVFDMITGEQHYNIPLPDLGAAAICGRLKDNFFYYAFTSFLHAGSIYRFDLGERKPSIWREISPPNFDPSRYETRQVFYKSKDGTRIPMFIIDRKDRPSSQDQDPPTLLYGYGGFEISLKPYFSPRWGSWIETLDGVIAIANLRGGGEYGEDWHSAGALSNKQNVFDDFQAAAKALTGELEVTTSGKLACMGGSNGGLLVGACINQAPELFGAAVAHVGVYDMLRFVEMTVGAAWVSDYGDPRKKEDFDYLIKYSPLHTVFNPDETGKPYPPFLCCTGDSDDRVAPLHSFKYVATLQHIAGKSKVQAQNPLLIRIETNAGHGAGKPTSKYIDELVDNLVFCSLTLDSPFKV